MPQRLDSRDADFAGRFQAFVEAGRDTDAAVSDAVDNCPTVFNPEQADSDAVPTVAPGNPVLRPVPGNAPVVVAGDEALSAPVNIGFTFHFQGRSYGQLRVSTNGFLTFSTSPNVNPGCCVGQALPDRLGRRLLPAPPVLIEYAVLERSRSGRAIVAGGMIPAENSRLHEEDWLIGHSMQTGL